MTFEQTPDQGDQAAVEGTEEPTVDATVTQTGEEYSTRGQVTVRTRPGHQFAPTNKDLPVIGSEGVQMSREHADEVIEESKIFGAGYVSEFEVDKADDEG